MTFNIYVINLLIHDSGNHQVHERKIINENNARVTDIISIMNLQITGRLTSNVQI